eukprot:m.43754 g.43754  ORF g.43754 m.43754 type:complete len:901 (-) comp10793_c0_seq2:52-2754(-)
MSAKIKSARDAIDDGRVKPALDIVNRVLKRTPDNVEAKALQLMCLMMLHRTAEAQPLLEYFSKNVPTEPVALRTLVTCYRQQGLHLETAALYQTLAENDPSDQELKVQHFMALVRAGDAKAYDRAATNLFKLYKDDKYLAWQVMAKLVQAKQAASNPATSKLATAVLFPVCEKTLAKVTMTAERLKLLILVLESQKKYADILQLLADDAEHKFAEQQLIPPGNERTLLKIECLKHLDDVDQAQAVAVQTLQANHDDWNAFLALFDATQRRVAADPSAAVAVIADVDQVVATLVASDLEQPVPKRGVLLAQLKWGLERVKLLGSQPSTTVGTWPTLVDSLLMYFTYFGHKRCCYPDTIAFVDTLQDGDTTQFLKQCRAAIDANAATDPEWKTILRRVSLVKYARALAKPITLSLVGPADESEECQDEIQVLTRLFEDSIPAGAELKPSELQYGDEYASIAASILYEKYADNGKVEYLREAIELLEAACVKSAFNPQLRIFLVKLHCLLGNISAAHTHWQSMEVKQIQDDSVGYVLSDHLFALGGFDLAVPLLARVCKFFQQGDSDIPEFLCQAYQYETYHKIEEFERFKDRLANSQHNLNCRVENLMMSLMRTKTSGMRSVAASMCTIPAQADIRALGETLRDNSQFGVMDTFTEPKSRLSEADEQHIRKLRRAFVLYRAHLLRSLAAMLEADPSFFDGVDLLNEAYSTVWEIQSTGCAASRNIFAAGIAGPCTRMLSQLLPQQCSLVNVLTSLRAMAQLTVAGTRGEQLKTACADIESSFTTILSDLMGALEAVVDPALLPYNAIHACTQAAELLAFAHLCVLTARAFVEEQKYVQQQTESVNKKTAKQAATQLVAVCDRVVAVIKETATEFASKLEVIATTHSVNLDSVLDIVRHLPQP